MSDSTEIALLKSEQGRTNERLRIVEEKTEIVALVNQSLEHINAVLGELKTTVEKNATKIDSVLIERVTQEKIDRINSRMTWHEIAMAILTIMVLLAAGAMGYERFFGLIK